MVSQDGIIGGHYARITAHDAIVAGILPKEEIEDAKARLPDNVFRELYMAEPSDDEGNPFGVENIGLCIGPLSNEPVHCWGWDLAKSVDYTVGIALDSNGAVIKVLRFQKPWTETMSTIQNHTGKDFALVDSTGVGDPIVETLQRENPDGRYEGYKFTQISKQQLMEGLAVAIQQRQIQYPDGPIVTELESFEYEYTRTGVKYAAAEGMHDDCVCALALALHKLKRPIAVPRLRFV